MAAVLFTVEYKWLQNFGDLFLKLGNEISLLSVPFKYHLGVRSLFFPPSLSFRSFRVFSMVSQTLVGDAGGRGRHGFLAVDLGSLLCFRSSYSLAATPPCCRSSASCPSSISVTHG